MYSTICPRFVLLTVGAIVTMGEGRGTGCGMLERSSVASKEHNAFQEARASGMCLVASIERWQMGRR